MHEYGKELINKTIEIWSAEEGYRLSEEEAIKIIQNMTNYSQALNSFAIKIAEDISKKLFEQGNFHKIGDIDNLVPEEIGLYCIRLAEKAILPEKYQEELDNRKSRIIYIGKAEMKTLRDRFLKQELRAKGHGTFFRSVGAMLGFTPLPGSLKDKRNKKNYKFTKADESKIIDWMNANLEASWIKFDDLFIIEKYLIEMHRPLLNIESNPQKFQNLLNDREKCIKIALG
jgi:hypothetical protein